tara:strand:+ start:2804 stop:4942 length:2139 start_codon:yes stop_codon:yes gene_type:complete
MSANHVTIECQNELKTIAEVMTKIDDVAGSTPEADKLLRDMIKNGLKGKKPNGFQMFNEFMINGMLSGFGTPIVNLISNTVQTLMKPTLAVIGSSMSNNKALKREARALFSASFEGLGQDLIFLNKGYKAGLPVDFELSPRALGLSQKDFNRYMDDLKIPIDPRTGTASPADVNRVLGVSYDYITKSIPGPLGDVIRIPTRLTVGIDEYFKARLRSQKTMALVSRKASADEEKGLGTYDELFNKYKKEAFYDMKAPPANLDSKGIADWNIQETQKRADYVGRLKTVFGNDEDFATAIYDVRNYATDGTFQTKLTGNLEKFSNLRGQGDTLGQTALLQAIPFLRTPWNLTMEGISYVPGIGIAIKPGVSKTVVKMKKAADGTEYPVFETNVARMSKEETAARQVIGLGALLGMGALWDADRLTGSVPDSAADRNQWQANGKQPYSIKVGDEWISFQRVDPFAMVLGLAADTFEMNRKLASGEVRKSEQVEYLQAASYGMLKSNILEKTFLQGFADLLAVAESPREARAYLDGVAKRVVPAISNTFARGLDPYEREAVGLGDKLKQRVPGLRETLPASYASYSADPNNPAPRETNFSQAWTGVAIADQPTEFQQRMNDLGVKFSPKSARLSKVDLNTEELADYKRFINENASKLFGRSLPNLERLPNRQVAERQARKLMSAATKRARNQLMLKYPEKRAEIRAQSLYDKYGLED